MKINKSNFISENNKISLIFDIDPFNQEIINNFASKEMSFFFKRISNFVNFIFVTSINFDLFKKRIIDVLKIKHAHVICNNGASVYRFVNKKSYMIFENELCKNEKMNIIHALTSHSLASACMTSNKVVVYSPNKILLDFFIKKFISDTKNFYDFRKFSNFILENKCLSILTFDQSEKLIFNEYLFFSFFSNFYNVNISKTFNKTFSFSSNSKKTKFNHIYEILWKLKFHDFNSVLYFSINSFDDQLWNSFNNHFISFFNYKMSTTIRKKINFSNFINFDYKSIFFINNLRDIILNYIPYKLNSKYN